MKISVSEDGKVFADLESLFEDMLNIEREASVYDIDSLQQLNDIKNANWDKLKGIIIKGFDVAEKSKEPPKPEDEGKGVSSDVQHS